MRPVLASTVLIAGVSLLVLGGYLMLQVVQAIPLFQRSFSAAIPSVPLPFGVVLTVIGWKWLRGNPEGSELMSVSAWRRLAIALFVIAAVTGLVFHWFAAVTPSVLAIICLLKDPAVAEKLIGLSPF